MIEVFFSEAAKYSMMAAKQDKDHLLSGNPKEVLNIGSHLDIGDISGNPFEHKRLKYLNERIHHEKLTESELEQLSDNQSRIIEKLKTAASFGKTVRIWKSDAPFSACGFAFVCNQLENIQCDIRVVSLVNDSMSTPNTLVTYNHWGEVSPGDYHAFLADEVNLSNVEKKNQSLLWEELKKENSFLRAMVNGQLISVPENFYDHLLLKNLPEEEFIVGEFLADILGKYPLGVSDSWYLVRMNQMIKENKLEITFLNNNVNPYQKKMKKIQTLKNE